FQFAQKILKEFTRIALSLEQVRGARRIAQSLEHLIQERRLAHARLRDQRQKSPAAQDSLCERVERLAVRPARVQISGVGSDTERLLLQPGEIQKHGRGLLLRTLWGKRLEGSQDCGAGIAHYATSAFARTVR